MSDTQDPLLVLQRRAQQRQILAVMGINQWVQPQSDTLQIADIPESLASQSDAQYLDIEQPVAEPVRSKRLNPSTSSTDALSESASSELPSVEKPSVNTAAISATVGKATATDDVYESDGHESDSHAPLAKEYSPVTYHFDSVTTEAPIDTSPNTEHTTARAAINSAVQSATMPAVQTQLTQAIHNEELVKVAPFDLQGGRYGNWVVLVDIKALNSDSQKLWQNMTQALSMNCETTSFPICAGMDTAELANASLAGYVFKIGRSENVQVAALTVLPDHLYHPNLQAVPTLDDMLADSDKKRQLWAQLSREEG